ncbi:MAG: hypothetical protein BAJALOKI1v1_700010 [Promethearchaeota archaeon]|nr:MAG: hypothetical protein BAJALOKI1v1_700010 [Candidatus Lokiarchaeota archaeon]
MFKIIYKKERELMNEENHMLCKSIMTEKLKRFKPINIEVKDLKDIRKSKEKKITKNNEQEQLLLTLKIHRI